MMVKFSEKQISLTRVVIDCFVLLSTRDRLLVGVVAAVQTLLVFLDILGIFVIGTIFAIATSAIQGSQMPQTLKGFIDFLGFANEKPQTVVTLLGCAALFAFIAKSLASYNLNKSILNFLSLREAKIAGVLSKGILSLSIIDLNKFSTPQYQHAITAGTTSVMSGVIGNSVSLLGELSLQIGMLFALLFFSPMLTGITLVFFMALLLILNQYQGQKAREWNRQSTELDVIANMSLSDAIAAFREIKVLQRMPHFEEKILSSREKSARINVHKSMLSFLSKYFFEVALIILVLLVATFAFYTRSAVEAASLLAVFIAANSRIAPSMLRIQQGVILLRGAAGATELFFQIKSFIGRDNGPVVSGKTFIKTGVLQSALESHSTPLVELRGVTVQYPNTRNVALLNVDFSISSGTKVSLVGPSGAGKTTLVDTLLGLVPPTKGLIYERGIPRPTWSESRSIDYAYVPQNCHLIRGSLIENICLGLPRDQHNLERVWEVLNQVGLSEWVRGLPMQIDQNVGERGSRLSGGQRQRIGIARAIYSVPDFLVLDEATSSLDADSEASVSLALESLRGKVTMLVIAHRLSTVMNSDKVAYLDSGRILGEGTFSELRKIVPDFDRQANLLGID